MLGLGYYACAECDTVYADVDEPPGCERCASTSFDELAPEGGAAAYFARER